MKVAFSAMPERHSVVPIEVDDGDAVGPVDTLLLPDGSALACWMSGTVESGQLKCVESDQTARLARIKPLERESVLPITDAGWHDLTTRCTLPGRNSAKHHASVWRRQILALINER